MSLRIKYWGTRGSIPSSPSPQQWVHDFEHLLNSFFKKGYREASQIREFIASYNVPQIGGFGAHTTCAEIQSDKGQIIIDGGSGIRNLGEFMMKSGAGKGGAHIHIFLTHFHWDHLIGLPFFVPHFIKGNTIHYYAVQSDLEKFVRLKFCKPLFPVAFETLPAEIKFHILEPRKSIKISDMAITPYQLDHPDPCWGFKVESSGKVYSHCVDTEGTRGTPEAMGPDLPLYQGVDVMYFDAQYTLPALAEEKANWGHSAAQIGLDIAFREQIKHVIFAHHDPGATTQQIYQLKQETRDYYDWRLKSAQTNHIDLPHVKWRYAYDGLVVDLQKLDFSHD